MQSVDDFIFSLQLRNIEMRVEDGQLHLSAARGTIQQPDMEKIRALKYEIIESLRQQDSLKEPLRARTAGCLVPLTAGQYKGWQVFAGSGRLSERMCASVMRVTGALDTLILQKCVEAIVQRHESLRTRFIAVDGTPAQHIDTDIPCQMELVDLSALSTTDAEQQALRLIDEFVGTPVNLTVGPLFATRLWRLTRHEYILVFALDHTISDAESNAIVVREVWDLYGKAFQGHPILTSQLPLQLADYAVWQQRTSAAWFDKHAAYWKTRLHGAPQAIIPCDKNLVKTESPTAKWMDIPFGNALSDKLRDVARRERTLLALVVQTIHIAVLSNWCEQQDFIVGSIYNGRVRPELEGMVGFLATGLYLRIEIRKDDSFVELLRRVILEYELAQEHYDFGRVPNIVPEFRTEIGFNWGYSIRPLQHQQITIQPILFRRHPPPGKFGGAYVDTATGIIGRMFYRPDLLAKSTIERFAYNLRLLANEISNRPLARINSILT